jgi:hypothetical protein
MQALVEAVAHRLPYSRNIAAAICSCVVALISPAAFAQPEAPCTPPTLPLQPNGWYKLNSMPYGDGANWLEFKDRNKPVGGANHLIPLKQIADFWVPSLDVVAKPRPLIIFAHPGGGSEQIEDFPVLRKFVLKEAMQADFALASLEFRHPQASFVRPEECPVDGQCPFPPSSDIGNAVQFFRHHARQFCIDPDNIFLVGQSRGSLALLHAIGADDLKQVNPPPKSPWRAQSSKVRAVWAYQAQTTYRENELAGFVSTDPYPNTKPQQTYREVFVDDYIDLPYDPGSAYSRVTRGDDSKMPFAWLSYDEDPTSMTAVTRQTYCSKTLDDDSCGGRGEQTRSNFDVHDANFGVRLKNAHKQAGLGSRVTLCVNGGKDRADHGYAGLIDFFKAHMDPAIPGATAPDCVTQHQPKLH